MIKIDHLSKKYNDNVVLDDISLEIKQGDVVGIIGPSGTGKSTLLRCVNRLETPEKGTVTIGDKVIGLSERKPKELLYLRQNTGMVFQRFNLFPHMTVLENVMFPLDMFSNDTYKDRLKRAQFCLDRVNLSEAGHLYPSEISGGMMKRAAIARAIALNPKYLFCDEPNSGLDPKTSLIIDDLIHDITAEYKMTTIINTHDMNSVMNIGENIIFIKEGVKEWQGNSKEVITSKNKALNDFIFASDLFRKVKEVEEEELKEEELKAK